MVEHAGDRRDENRRRQDEGLERDGVGKSAGHVGGFVDQREDAEDAAQETFLRVLRNLHRWDATRDFEPWLLAIAGNRCRTALSNRKRRPAPQALLEPYPDRAPEEEPARCLAEEVRLALAELRDEYRQAFVLFHEQQLSYAEIGQTLDRPLGTIKTWVHRARKEMIDFLKRREAVHDNERQGGLEKQRLGEAVATRVSE